MLSAKVLIIFSIATSMGFCEIPMSFYLQFQNINSSADIFKKFVKLDTWPTISNNDFPGDGGARKAYEQLNNDFAESDVCAPKMTSVRFPKDSDPNIVLIPQCTHMHRCGGCCGHEALTCTPESQELIDHKVARAEYVPGASSGEELVYKDTVIIQLANDTKCKCECRVKETDCTSKHTYNGQECKCVCLNEEDAASCNEAQTWDAQECECVCIKTKNCEEGLYFNTRTCQCELPVTANELLISKKSDKPTETTTTIPAPSDPCLSINCPNGYAKIRLVSGGCRCKYNFGSGFGRRKR